MRFFTHLRNACYRRFLHNEPHAQTPRRDIKTMASERDDCAENRGIDKPSNGLSNVASGRKCISIAAKASSGTRTARTGNRDITLVSSVRFTADLATIDSIRLVHNDVKGPVPGQHVGTDDANATDTDSLLITPEHSSRGGSPGLRRFRIASSVMRASPPNGTRRATLAYQRKIDDPTATTVRTARAAIPPDRPTRLGKHRIFDVLKTSTWKFPRRSKRQLRFLKLVDPKLAA